MTLAALLCRPLLAAALAAIPLAAAEPDSARIARVEQGLRPAVSIRGQPQPKWTFEARMAFHKTPGVSVAVIAGGKLAWARGYGAVAKDGSRVDAGTLFQAASISKPVAAMTALRLVEQGKLSLDEDVNVKLRSWKVPENEFTRTEKVTLRRLLNHSAGLTVHGFPGYAASAEIPSLVDILNGNKPANTSPIRVDMVPGTRMRYSGGGYEVMQQLVVDVTGKSFPELAQELVLGPLGMTRSTYRQPLPPALASNAAAAHSGDGTLIEGRWHTYPEMAAAGLWTTPSDLVRFALELQQGGPVLKPETRGLMLTKLLGDYGLGLSLAETGGRKSFSHGGSNAGFRCTMFAYVEGGGGAVVMTNGDRGTALAGEILRSISAEYGWADYKTTERTVVQVSPDILRSYAGRYALQNGPEVTIAFRDGKLFATTQGSTFELFPESDTAFFAQETGVPPIRFRKSADSVEMTAGNATAKRQ